MNSITQLLAWWDASPGTVSAASAALAVSTLVLLRLAFPSRKDGIRKLGGISILTAWTFFSKRYDFLRSNFQKTGESAFKFNILHHTVVAVRGTDARKAFFDNKSLNIAEGYKILMGAAPRLSDASVQNEAEGKAGFFNKQLSALFQRDRLTDLLPSLFEDVNNRASAWGKEGRIDPFKGVYDLVVQMTVRMATCRELAVDTEAVKRLQSLYWTLEKSATPTALLLPWFPSRAKKAKTEATKALFGMLYGYVEKRKAAKVPNSDTIDLLLSQGLGNNEIIQLILGIIFGGLVNTGINASWTLFFLALNPEWKGKVVTEIKDLVERHTNTASSDPLHKRLSAIPIAAWEDEMPVMESVIRETIRIVVATAVLRRNIVEDIPLGHDQTLSKDNFLIYHLADVHLNPDIYPNPSKFDPDRFSPGREEDKKVPLAYLGWGAGRHPCLGVKVAKVEIKVIVALFAVGYEFEAVDESGKFPASLPKPNYNDIHQARPIGDPCYLKFKRVVD